jgi:hypothetical protein
MFRKLYRLATIQRLLVFRMIHCIIRLVVSCFGEIKQQRVRNNIILYIILLECVLRFFRVVIQRTVDKAVIRIVKRTCVYLYCGALLYNWIFHVHVYTSEHTSWVMPRSGFFRSVNFLSVSHVVFLVHFYFFQRHYNVISWEYYCYYRIDTPYLMSMKVLILFF